MKKYDVKLGDRYYVRRGGDVIEVEVTKILYINSPSRCWWTVTDVETGYRFDVFHVQNFKKRREDFL